MKRITFGTIALALIIVSIYTINYSKINTSPTKKIVGSQFSNNTMHFERPTIESLNQLIEPSYLIVVGTVLTDAVNSEINLPSDLLDTQLTQKLASVEIDIEKVVYGSLESKTITFVQLGVSGDDQEQTKVKKGEKVLLVLKECDIKNSYASVALEDGVFIIDDKEKVICLSDNLELSKYDGKKLDVLLKELGNSISEKIQ